MFDSELQIIDWDKSGNVVRFFLGDKYRDDYWGDDWDDRPYEHNAGEVYDRYKVGHVDYFFPFDWMVVEPQEDWHYKGNSPYCKDDFRNRFAPCVIIVPDTIWHKDAYTWRDNCYSEWLGADGIYRVYFGDEPGDYGEVHKEMVIYETRAEED